MTIYRMSYFGADIETVEVERVTKHFAIFKNGKRDALIGRSSLYTTKEQVIAEWRKVLQARVNNTQKMLELERKRLDEFNEKYPAVTEPVIDPAVTEDR